MFYFVIKVIAMLPKHIQIPLALNLISIKLLKVILGLKNKNVSLNQTLI